MLVGPEHRGSIRRTTTTNGMPHVPIHRGFQQSGCMDSINRLVTFIQNENNPDVCRFVGNIPSWLTDTCFAHACSRTTTRDAMEYARRFLRLRVCLQSESGSAEDTQVPLTMCPTKVERAVSIARLSFGAALEAAAALAASRICETTQLPSEAPHSSRLARLCHDAYMASIWTDAHVNYVLNALVEGSHVDELDGPHMDLGCPCIHSTTSISSLPNMAAKFERFCSSPNSIDEQSKNLVSVIFRCGQSGSRGWDSALKTSLASPGSQSVLHKAFKMALIGMHPQLHPAARPDWAQRALTLRLLNEHLTKEGLNKIMVVCGTCTKESIRLYMCSVMNEIPATRLALSKVHNSIGLLRSAPAELVQASLAAAAQNIVAAGIASAAALSELRASGLDSARAEDVVRGTICEHIGNEPRVRSRASTHSKPISIEKYNRAATPGTNLVLRDSTTMKTFYAVTYNPSWFGRMVAETCEGEEETNGTSDGHTSNSMNVTSVIHELTSRAFRAAFIPFWMHGHGNDIRASRFDPSQHVHMLSSSTVHSVITKIDEREALRVQRIALRTHTSATSTVAQAGELLGFGEDDQKKLNDSKTFEEAMTAVCSLSAKAGASMLLFGKVTSMKNRFLSFDLGPETKRRQISALVRRFEVDPMSEDLVKDLPDHATHLYTCLECKRIPNACVDEKSKMVTHNEIGLAQTMLRVGGITDAPEIRCARRSSAALRTAIQKEGDAVKNRIECIDVTDEALKVAMRSNGDVSHAARLRRDIRTCSEQHECALACGDRPLVRISLLGRVVRMHGRFYALCALCGSIMQVTQTKRFGGDLCCCRCDASMVGIEKAPTSQATRVAVEVDSRSTRTKPFVFEQIVPHDKLHCRFCNKHPPTSSTATRFRIFRTPRDNGGRNASLPPPLRTVALCSSHWRPWVQNALNTMDMPAIFAHISAKATPVFGADVGRKHLALTLSRPTPVVGKLQKKFLKRARGAKVHASSSSSKR